MEKMLSSKLLKFALKLEKFNPQDTLQNALLNIINTKNKLVLYEHILMINYEIDRQIEYINDLDDVIKEKKQYLCGMLMNIKKVINIDLWTKNNQLTRYHLKDKLMILDHFLILTYDVDDSEIDSYSSILNDIKSNMENIQDETIKSIAEHILKEFDKALNMYEIYGSSAFKNVLEKNLCKFDIILNSKDVEKETQDMFKNLIKTTLDMTDAAARGNFLAQGVNLLINNIK